MQVKLYGLSSNIEFSILWTLFLLLLALPMSIVILMYGPKTMVPTPWLTLIPNSSGQYQEVTIYTHHPPPLSEVDVTFRGLDAPNSINPGPYVDIRVQLPAMTYHAGYFSGVTSPPPGNGPLNVPLNSVAVLDLLECVGANKTHQDVKDEADELLTIIRASTTQGVAGYMPMHFTANITNSGYEVPAMWFLVSLLIFWILVWVAGMVKHARIRTKWQLEAAGFGVD